MVTRKSDTTPEGNVLLDNQIIELNGDTEVLAVVTLELVVICVPLFVVGEKPEYDEIQDASGPLRNARRAVPWRRQSPWVGIYVGIESRRKDI